jgi:hypothetical protein
VADADEALREDVQKEAPDEPLIESTKLARVEPRASIGRQPLVHAASPPD